MSYQPTLFDEPKTELAGLWESLESLKVSHGKVRKRLFAEVGELKKQLATVKLENEKMKFHTEVKPKLKWTA